MKKILLFVSALSGLFLAGSCQREELAPVEEAGVVTFEVNVPGVATKGIGDVPSVDNLVYEVYWTDAETVDATISPDALTLLYKGTKDVVKGKSTVPVELLKDKNYVILFWAQRGNTWGFASEDRLLKNGVTFPDEFRANAEDIEAFYGVSFLTKTKLTGSKNVTLYRPFAQLNVGTTVPTYYKDPVVLTHSAVTVKNAGASFNLIKQCSENKKDVTFTSANVPSEKTLSANNSTYNYAAMNYIFANGNVDVKILITTANHGTISLDEIPAVPVEKNYRTNIIGDLLTSDANYNVVLDTEWGTPSTDVEMWNGESIKAPVINEAGEYVIKSASELAWFAAAVNGTLPATTSGTAAPKADNFEGKTVILAADIHLNNKEWTPIGNESARFHGTFDGKEHTIYGLSILNYNGDRRNALFGNVAINPTIKNLTIDGANVIMPEGHNDDFYAAGLIASFYGTLNVENVTVQNSNFAGNNKIGGLLAHDAGCTSMIIKNCHVLNCDIRSTHLTDGGNVGGLLGFFQGAANKEHKITDSSVENCTIYGINSSNTGHRSNGEFVGCLSGKDDQTLVIENCELSENTFTQNEGVTYVSPYGVFVGGNRNDDGKGKVIVDGHEIITASTAEKFVEAVNTPNAQVIIPANTTVDLPASIAEGVTIEGSEGSVINFAGKTPANFNNVTFKNITIKEDNNAYSGIQHSDVINYVDCVIEGCLQVYSINTTFTRCIFKNDGDNYAVWLYGGGSSIFENCQFKTSLNKAVLVYNETAIEYDVTLNDCTFTAKECTKDKAAVQIHTELGIYGSLIINRCTAENFYNQTGRGVLWSELNNSTDTPTHNFNVTVDGVVLNRVGYTKLTNYPNIWVKDNNYYVFDKAGLAELNNFFKANSFANHVWTRSYNIGADIDATGFTWDCVHMVVGSNDLNGLVLNGNGYTISNLTIDGGGLFTGTPKGANEGTTYGYVKNITIDNAAVTGDHNASVFWANAHGEIVYENVIVKNTAVTGNCNVGVFIGATTIDYPTSKIDPILFKYCAVENCIVVANGKDGQDPTGASGFVGRAFANTSLKFEGTNTIDEATTITNNNGLVGGRVYAYTTLIDGNWEGTGACDTFTDFAGVEAVKVGTAVYGNFADAIAAAKTGDTISLLSDVTLAAETKIPAGVTLKGNGKQINGSIYAGGDLTFEGHTKVTGFSASYYDRTITIGEGACLEVTGTGRVTFGYGNTFDITGSIADAKNTDKTTVQPSMIIPGGISITGGSDFTMNLTNAYVQIGSTSSKNNVANGTFTLNIVNSIAEFTDQLTFAEPKDGKIPTFNLNITNSQVTTPKKLCIAAPNSNVIIDNSTVTLGTYLRNSGELTLKNGSKLTGSTIQFGENGGNDGTINVDNSELTITATSTGQAFDGTGTGEINLTNSAEASVTYYKAMTINVDATSTFTGTEVK